MNSFSSYISKLLLMNACAALLLGTFHVDRVFSADFASSEDESASVPANQTSSGPILTASGQQAVAPDAPASAPIIEHALDTIDKAKHIQDLFGLTDYSNRSFCADCEQSVASIRYMQCSSKNDYLEKQLEEQSQEHTMMGALIRHPVQPDSIIKPVCVRMSMESRFGENSKSFRQCGANGLSGPSARPCISENYFKLLNNSFSVVSECMKDFVAKGESGEMQKLDVRAAFALINVESGFHINAMSGTSAGGIGQLTRPAIADVNQNQMDDVREMLESSSDKRCNHLSLDFLNAKEPMRPAQANSCDRISLQRGNPVTNMIYTFAYLRGVKESMNRQIFENRGYKKKFNLSDFDMAKIKRAMVVWSHNTGPSGTLTPVKALLNRFYRNQKVTDADKFINQLQQYMVKFPARSNNTPARLKETARYFPDITKYLTAMEKDAGGGTCVN